MSRLKLNPDPTFHEKVEIPVPGGAAVKVDFTFKHRTRDEMRTFLDGISAYSDDVDFVLAMVTGWELADDFNRENVAQLVQAYIAAPGRIFDAYLEALTGAKRKN